VTCRVDNSMLIITCMECAKSVNVEIENYTVPEGSLRWLCSGQKEEDGVHKWTHDSSNLEKLGRQE